ncbi:ABC transporter ATP-binding protein [Microvirga pudoricolor]|uniref:ABC transporter ATP-binding protein n=1 Tax=Microvirga pudoricolor TaxID=2778729 RepID=UPI0019517534|nr:oligopeptide/dipeptide ABC transporter ATP-binding protein [Microvirga pudoricolor]MBM6593567.1 ATP-binding cassette domain-containing protein [Microvirga pudoricolor]
MNPAQSPHGALSTTGRSPDVLLEGRNLSRVFGRKTDLVAQALIKAGLAQPPKMLRAVDRVDLTIKKGEVVGLVGESGCGKSTLGRVIAGIIDPTEGELFWQGCDIRSLSSAERRQIKLGVQMIFQNPFASLNPRMTIEDVVGEAPRIHGFIQRSGKSSVEYIDEQMRRAGLPPALKSRYAHELSGGQRQRIGIARALAVQPEVLVCDESVASLDVSIQAQIINLFMDLRQELQLTYLFISHDLSLVEHISDRVIIMYLGRVVEEAPVEEIFSHPNHPYTRALLAEIPRLETTKRRFTALKGELPSPMSPPPGCHFHPRCPHAFERCKLETPQLKEVAPNHVSACHLNDAGQGI